MTQPARSLTDLAKFQADRVAEKDGPDALSEWLA